MTKKRAAAAVVVLGMVAAVFLVMRGCAHRATTEASERPAAQTELGAAHGSGRGSGARAPSVPASIAGRVTRKSDGGGIAGAYVSVARAELGALFLPSETPTIVVLTDATGAWRVPQIAPGSYTIGATALGMLPGSIEKLAIASGAAKTGVDLALDAGGTLVRGTVTDIGGGPIEGARITVKPDKDMEIRVPVEYVTVTGADGRYQLTLQDGDFSAIASDEDYAKLEKNLEVAGQPVTLDFTLLPGASIHGIVVTQDGKPVPGALVQVSQPGQNGQVESFSKDDGTFVLKGLGTGALSLTATGRGYTSDAPTVVEVGIGEDVDGVRVVVDRALMISGHVVKKGTKDGIAGVRIGMFSFKGVQALAVDPSEEDGYFEVHGVKAGSYMAFAMGEDVMIEIGQPVEVVDKDVTDVVIEMARGATLRGRVEPPIVTSISIELDASKIGIGNLFEAIKSALVRAQSKADGTFELHNVPPGTFTLAARAKDGRTGKLAVVVTAADQDNLVLRLEPRASVAGRVLDAKGGPVAGVRVDARRPSDNLDFSINDSPTGSATARTADDGAFKLVGLDDGKLTVSVVDDHGPLAWAHPVKADKPQAPIELEIAKAEQRTGLVLTVEARDGWIRGIVVGADRKPVADAWVSAAIEVPDPAKDGTSAAGDGTTPILTGADGKFAIEHLRHVAYTITVDGPRGASRATKRKVNTGDTVTITLEPLGTLTGRVTASGAPVATFDISCTAAAGNAQRRVTNPAGTYTLDRIAPGSYKCSVTSDAGTATSPIEIPAGPAKLDVALTAYASVTGVVVNALTGAPVPGVRAMAASENADSDVIGAAMIGRGPSTDASGRFVVDKVAPGKGNVALIPKDGGFLQLASREYTAVAGQRVDVGTIKIVPPRTGDAGTLGLGTSVEDGKLLVANVKDGGPAALAGIVLGDHIVSIDGHPVTDPEVGRQLVASGTVAVGQVVVLGVDRAGTPATASITAVAW